MCLEPAWNLKSRNRGSTETTLSVSSLGVRHESRKKGGERSRKKHHKNKQTKTRRQSDGVTPSMDQTLSAPDSSSSLSMDTPSLPDTVPLSPLSPSVPASTSPSNPSCVSLSSTLSSSTSAPSTSVLSVSMFAQETSEDVALTRARLESWGSRPMDPSMLARAHELYSQRCSCRGFTPVSRETFLSDFSPSTVRVETLISSYLLHPMLIIAQSLRDALVEDMSQFKPPPRTQSSPLDSSSVAPGPSERCLLVTSLLFSWKPRDLGKKGLAVAIHDLIRSPHTSSTTSSASYKSSVSSLSLTPRSSSTCTKAKTTRNAATVLASSSTTHSARRGASASSTSSAVDAASAADPSASGGMTALQSTPTRTTAARRSRGQSSTSGTRARSSSSRGRKSSSSRSFSAALRNPFTSSGFPVSFLSLLSFLSSSPTRSGRRKRQREESPPHGRRRNHRNSGSRSSRSLFRSDASYRRNLVPWFVSDSEEDEDESDEDESSSESSDSMAAEGGNRASNIFTLSSLSAFPFASLSPRSSAPSSSSLSLSNDITTIVSHMSCSPGSFPFSFRIDTNQKLISSLSLGTWTEQTSVFEIHLDSELTRKLIFENTGSLHRLSLMFATPSSFPFSWSSIRQYVSLSISCSRRNQFSSICIPYTANERNGKSSNVEGKSLIDPVDLTRYLPRSKAQMIFCSSDPSSLTIYLRCTCSQLPMISGSTPYLLYIAPKSVDEQISDKMNEVSNSSLSFFDRRRSGLRPRPVGSEKKQNPLCSTSSRCQTAAADEEIVALSEKVSLICPLSLRLIQYPARGECCGHIQCFDLKNFLEIFARSDAWKCPICSKKLSYETTYIDRDMLSVVRNAPPGSLQAEIRKGSDAVDIRGEDITSPDTHVLSIEDASKSQRSSRTLPKEEKPLVVYLDD